MTTEEFNERHDLFSMGVKMELNYPEFEHKYKTNLSFVCYSINAAIVKSIELLSWIQHLGFNHIEVWDIACKKILGEKAIEYGAEDRLTQFKESATLIQDICVLPNSLSLFIAGFAVASKHYAWINLAKASVYTITQEALDEHVGDAINYLFINTMNLMEVSNGSIKL